MGFSSRYADSGVDEPREQQALLTMLRAFRRTLGVRQGDGSAVAEQDHFGSLIHLPGALGLAVSTDGVGTKLVLAQQTRRYREIARDLIANNVNDILCMGATPIAIVDYIGIDIADERFLEEFSEGLADGALEARVAIVGGEIAQIGEMFNPSHGSPRFDVVATAIGLCSLSEAGDKSWPRALDRKNVKAGDVLIGLASSGPHSNGYSLARRVLQTEAKLDLNARPPELEGATIADALLVPTRIYVKVLAPLLEKGLINGLANISGGGLLTVARLNPKMGFELTSLPQAQPIFGLIGRYGGLADAEIYSTFNMGVGMMLAVSPDKEEGVMRELAAAGEKAFRMGRVFAPEVPGEIRIPSLRLRGVGHEFEVD